MTISICYAQENSVSEELLIMNDSIHLQGVLTYKNDQNPQALAIFIQGSGNPDKNGNQLGMNIKANYIKQLAEALLEQDIAMFRYDKRNVPEVNHKIVLKHYVFDDLVDDVKTIIEHFKGDKRFDQIVLIGHSQGSLVGMLAIEAGADRYISLAGLSKSADEAIVWQISKQNEGLSQVAAEHFKELKETGKIDSINPLLYSIFNPTNNKFFKNYIKYNPVEEIGRIKIPTLIINGNMDLQVSAEDAEALHHALPDAEFKIISKMNHVLKHLESDEDNMQSYYTEDYPVSPELVEVIAKFIKD
ncbi:MAG: alpha/beta hydrolase [Bacteroidia bacterium]|nr:alpha/beta hydrolase [Bacteroidia bacterium]MBT8268636.1 alpha/beta hydrolase [Bacteroidia bacterium]NNF81379.1 alpha/beta hydrolase [Flavobacteriaceae bacterium]NNK69422.1 alpha/beta hydrolase [Flavobacteriaceae bacterium]NNL79480.1 alpha/beta hydrolase [Flavobacteriaceae bacterium]